MTNAQWPMTSDRIALASAIGHWKLVIEKF